VLRIRIVQRPPISGIDGIRLDHFEVGAEYEVGNITGALLLAEGWAEPLPLDSPSAEPFASEPIDPTALLRHRRDLVRQLHRGSSPRARAADRGGKSRR
jgi:hypothetical protein